MWSSRAISLNFIRYTQGRFKGKYVLSLGSIYRVWSRPIDAKWVAQNWDGTFETAKKIQEETKATIRVIPSHLTPEPGECVYSGKPSKERVIFAVAY